jgi:hypothetical protein
MPITQEVSPKKLQDAVQRGVKRLANFRNARIHFLKEYTGSYYDRTQGEVGANALNLIFNAVRVLVPNLVMNFPKHTLMTPYLQIRDYALNLGLALDQHDKKIQICDTYRRAIVDAIFTFGVLKTGLAQSNSVYAIDDELKIDAGTVYTEAVDFDNFIVDPNSKEHLFRDAAFLGDKMVVPRKMLLDSGLYNNELIEKLPRAGDIDREKKAFSVSMGNIEIDENFALEDDVEIAELWIPSANAIVTVPGSPDVCFDDYLRVDDYYGVDEGPYTFLSLTPPVPGNPLPIPMVGIWYDLHILANRMAKKVVEQAERQKSIVAYKRASADDAKELAEAGDGEAVAVDDPEGVATINFGGQQNSNEVQLANLQNWFNMMSGNTNQLGGQNVEAKSATAANILQTNSATGVEDMKDQVYRFAAAESRKRAWYFHTDPLMKIPLVRRQLTNAPTQFMGPQGPQWLAMPTMQDIQVILTPEARRGDFLDFVFTIEPESMSRVDSKIRQQQAQAFCQQVMPAVMTAASLGMQMGIPINAVALLIRMAKESGIEWLDEVLYDPQFQQQMMMQMLMGPQMGPSKGQISGQPNQPNQPNSGINGILQNGQPPSVQGSPMTTPQQEQNAGAQGGANDAQRMIRSVLSGAFKPPASGAGPLPTANGF